MVETFIVSAKNPFQFAHICKPYESFDRTVKFCSQFNQLLPPQRALKIINSNIYRVFVGLFFFN